MLVMETGCAAAEDEDIEKMMSDSIIKSATKYKTEFGESVLGYESSWNKSAGCFMPRH